MNPVGEMVATTARTKRMDVRNVIRALQSPFDDYRLTEMQAHGFVLGAILSGSVSLVFKKVYPSRNRKVWCLEATEDRWPVA